MQSAEKDARKDCGRDERIVYTALMDCISSIYNMYKSSVALYILSFSPLSSIDGLTRSARADRRINELCRRCTSFMAHSTANENVFMAEGFEVRFL